MNAHAFTVGRHVVFAEGKYQPQSDAGRRLLAHELTHTIQQQGHDHAGELQIIDSRDRSEREAEGVAEQVMQTELPPLPSEGPKERFVSEGAPGVHRQMANGDDGAAPAAKSLLTVTVWLNAFIPRDIPGLTKPVPNNPGKTMIPGPLSSSDCFLTDQRDFDRTLGASSRMTSVIAIDVTTSPAEEITQVHDCTATHEVDCEDGDEECVKKGSTSRMKFSDLKGTSFVTVKLSGASNNPCFSGSPDIDYKGKIMIDVAGRLVFADMLIDDFPAFEMYAAANNSSIGSTIFREPPPPGNTPGDLFGDATRTKSGSTSI